jgi:hypothetical protein
MERQSKQSDIAFVRKDADADDRLDFQEFLGAALAAKDGPNKSVKALFEALDVDKDQLLSFVEFRQQEVKSMALQFVQKDKDHDEFLIIDEMYPTWQKGKGSVSQKRKNDFRLYDEDGDDRLSKEEFENSYETQEKFEQLTVVDVPQRQRDLGLKALSLPTDRPSKSGWILVSLTLVYGSWVSYFCWRCVCCR